MKNQGKEGTQILELDMCEVREAVESCFVSKSLLPIILEEEEMIRRETIDSFLISESSIHH